MHVGHKYRSNRWSDRNVQNNHWQAKGSSRRFLQLPSVQIRSTRSLLQAWHTAQPIRSETELLQPKIHGSLESTPEPRRRSTYRQYLQKQIWQVEEWDTIKLLRASQIRHPTSTSTIQSPFRFVTTLRHEEATASSCFGPLGKVACQKKISRFNIHSFVTSVSNNN